MKNKHHLSASCLIDIIENQRFGVEYQPIICINNQEIFAYESLARFYDVDNQKIPPDIVYSSLHDSPLSLFQVEYLQKKLQLAYASKQADLFVNLDQDSYFSSGELKEKNPFLKLFKDFNRSNIIVELIENSEINDAIMSLSMINNLAKNNIQTAIDDVCNPQSMLSTAVIQLVSYVKLDKHVLANQHNRNFMLLVKSLVDYAHTAGKKIILEGVETEDDLSFAQHIKVDFVQGFHYKKLFKQVK
ncbi:EAL domain-containing protein [Thalassotalea sp. G2M2-11]|uniref:EAL domain-containing protein n=1 Tax=Thalassotalea sp. G2M2-11 TaxID=2787627 RepID=UPI0019D2BAF5|nr:EAL domain-containing protein [Thalassotalea sp. G2M2-11]